MTRFKDTAYSRIESEIRKSFSARKRLFIGLLTGTSGLIILFLLVFWLIPYVGLESIHPIAPWVLAAVVGVAILLVIWSSLALVLNILLKRPVLFSRRIRGITIKIFLPLMTAVGKLMGIPREQVRASFIRVNNEIVRAEGSTYRPEEILLLMPHCLQNSLCRYRLTYNIENCRRCGECEIASLLAFSESYGVKLAIATGGTIARRIVVQNRPKLIIAVACERDLSSGVQDTYPLPVFGILNERPFGPCLDTTVPLNQVQWAIELFLHPSCLPKAREARDPSKDGARQSNPAAAMHECWEGKKA
jgi:hypothetical protein